MKALGLRLQTQIALLVIAVLALSQIVSLRLFVDERAMAVEAAIANEAAGRAANVAKLLDSAPSHLRDDIVSAANSPLVQFELGDDPRVTHGNHDVIGGVESRIRALLNDGYSRDVRVEVHEAEQGVLPLPNLSPELAEMHAQMMRGTLTTVEMELSIAISGGQWLNVGTRFERPPVQWSTPAMAGFGLTATLLLIAGFWFLLSRVTSPLNALAAAAERIGRGDAEGGLPKTGPREVRDLTAAFNMMQARLSRFVRDRTQMLASLAHDLRSPLTAARVQAEMVDDDETRASLVASLTEMEDMVEATLAYAKGVGRAEDVVETDISEYLEGLRQHMHGSFDLAAGSSFVLPIKQGAMRRALRNLIENGKSYGQNPRVSWRASGEYVVIDIEDDGPGIPDGELENVFAPYHRLEASRSLETGGHGLGLSIARSIILEHGGAISLANRPEGGLRATVSLPWQSQNSGESEKPEAESARRSFTRNQRKECTA